MSKSKERTIKLSTIYQELIEKQVEEENPIEDVSPTITIDRLPLEVYSALIRNEQPSNIELINFHDLIFFIFDGISRLKIEKVIHLDMDFRVTTEKGAFRACFVFEKEPTPTCFTEKNTMRTDSPIYRVLTTVDQIKGSIYDNSDRYAARYIALRRLFKAFAPALIAACWTIINEITDFMSYRDRAHFSVSTKDILPNILHIQYSKKGQFNNKELNILNRKISGRFSDLSRSLPFKLLVNQNDICSIEEHGHSQILISVYDMDYRIACLDQFNVKFTN